MREAEGYIDRWHGLFPRFVFAAFVFAFLGEMIPYVVQYLIPVSRVDSSGLPLTYQVEEVSSAVFFSVAFFLLFYLASRIRVDLGRDYVNVAASIFLGVLALTMFYYVLQSLSPNAGSGGDAVTSILQSTGYAVFLSIQQTFVGFSAVLLSYWRRI